MLTGIFLGAYGQPTALRRRQPRPTAEALGELIDALCTRVPGLRRLRLSSLEPGDLTEGLIAIVRSHSQVVPHFHLPLQSGSDALLRRMNRQYGRDDFLQMIDRVRAAFDRPALTTDVVVGFPGETDAEFARTAEVVRAAGFIHVHAFPYSPRPGTAAARWTGQFVRGPVVNERIDALREIAAGQSLEFRRSFIGQTVEVIVERDTPMFAQTRRDNGRDTGVSPVPVSARLHGSQDPTLTSTGGTPVSHRQTRHGRCERYFDVKIESADLQPGDAVRVVVTEVIGDQTFGRLL